MSRPRLVEVLALAGLLGLAALLYGRSLHAAANYDEGVYLASLDALRHGQGLGTDVYASQPPGFYVLLSAVSLLPGDGVTDLRIGFLLLALVGLCAAYVIGRKIGGVAGGLGAAALLAVTAPYPVQAARVQADTASVALALVAIAVACYAGRSPWRWAAAGALAGATVSVKLLALPVAAPIAVLLVARRSWRAAGALVVGAGLVWVALAATYAGALGELWQTVVTDHRLARSLGPSLADNVHRVLLHSLDWKTPAGVLVPIGLVCAIVFLRRVELLALGAWIVASAAFLVYQRPLLDHHLVLLATALAVPAGAGIGAAVARVPRPARIAVAGVAALALAAGFVQEERRLDRQAGESPGVLWAAERLRMRTKPGAFIGSDLPIVPYLAGRRMPGQLVDTSFVRLGTGSLTAAEILATLDRRHVRAVVVGREFANRPLLLQELAARYRARTERDGVTIYLGPES
jgi:4-amino-4-deoxy-L-arabinose transferase-like glycosyltransferase